MATFRFNGRDINIHWNGYDIKGPAGTIFSIPDQLYEEFESDLRGAEPSLEWIDTNEFLTLQNSVSVTTLNGQFPISVTTTTSGKIVGVTSSTASDGYVLTADGSGGVAWEALPGDATGITNIIGTSPISAAVSGTSATISLTANYQTAGTYVNAVIGTSPASVVTASGTSTVSIDQSAITGATAATNAQTVRTYVKNTTGTTISKGSAVYVSGATGDNALISLATASTEVGSSKTLGITAEDIATDAFGYVVESGYLSGINTTGISAGTSVWLGTTPGSLVYGAPPAEPNHSVYLGVVIREQQNNGSILVKVQNGYELNELHDVFTTGVSTALPLVYSSTSSGWVAQALSSVGIADNAVVESKINAAAVTSSKIADNAIITSKILDAAVTSAKIGAGAINSTHIGANAVVAGKISANAVTSGNIAAGAVGSSQLADNAVVAAKISASAVGSAAIADNAVVAAKIAAASVGTAKISSGSSTSGQVLTANGSGGATFNTLTTTSVVASTLTTAMVNGSIISTTYATASSAASTRPGIAIDETNKILFQISGRTSIRKIDLNANTQISSTALALATNERLADLAFGGGKLIAVTGATAALGAALYYIIDPSAMTVQNSGNIKEAGGSLAANSYPNVKYDKQHGSFTTILTVASNTTGAATSADARRVFRIINPSTYSTRVDTTTSKANTVTGALDGSFAGVSTADGHPTWIASASRWAIGGVTKIAFYSDSGASTSFLTQTGSITVGSNSRFHNEIEIDPSSSSTCLYLPSLSSAGTVYSRSYRVLISEISAGYNSVSTYSPSGVYYADQGTTILGMWGYSDVRNIGGSNYILMGHDIFQDTGSSLLLFGSNPLSLTGADFLCGVNNTYGAGGGKIYYDGTSVNLILTWNTGGAGAIAYYRKATIGQYLDWTLIAAGSAYICGRSVTVVSGIGYSLLSGTGTRYAINASTPTLEIVAVPDGSAMTVRLTPDFSGSVTPSATFWTVR